MKELRHPHDEFFKAVFNRLGAVREFIRLYLNDIYRRIDTDTIQSIQNVFVDDSLKENLADCVYCAAERETGKAVYLLFEHKSYTDFHVGSQIIENTAMIIKYHREQHGRRAQAPLIMATMIHHGTGAVHDLKEEGTNCNFRLIEPFRDLPEIFPELFVTIVDLVRISDFSPVKEPALAIMLLTFARIGRENFENIRSEIAVIFRRLWEEDEDCDGLFRSWATYLISVLGGQAGVELLKEVRLCLSWIMRSIN